jgi:hypothetical protein
MGTPGGRASKVHALAKAQGRPIAFPSDAGPPDAGTTDAGQCCRSASLRPSEPALFASAPLLYTLLAHGLGMAGLRVAPARITMMD